MSFIASPLTLHPSMPVLPLFLAASMRQVGGHDTLTAMICSDSCRAFARPLEVVYMLLGLGHVLLGSSAVICLTFWVSCLAGNVSLRLCISFRAYSINECPSSCLPNSSLAAALAFPKCWATLFYRASRTGCTGHSTRRSCQPRLPSTRYRASFESVARLTWKSPRGHAGLGTSLPLQSRFPSSLKSAAVRGSSGSSGSSAAGAGAAATAATRRAKASVSCMMAAGFRLCLR